MSDKDNLNSKTALTAITITIGAIAACGYDFIFRQHGNGLNNPPHSLRGAGFDLIVIIGGVAYLLLIIKKSIKQKRQA